MNLKLVPVYLRDVTFKMEKVRDKEVRVVVASLFIQPLTYAIAQSMGVDGELYQSADKPVAILRAAELELGEGKKTHRIELHATVDASTDPTFFTEDAFLGRALKVRRDKEGPIFAGTIEVNFTYPDPKQLLAIANGINQQFWVKVSPTNPGLFEEADREAAKDEKKRKQRTVNARETTDGAEGAKPQEFPVDDNPGGVAPTA